MCLHFSKWTCFTRHLTLPGDGMIQTPAQLSPQLSEFYYLKKWKRTSVHIRRDKGGGEKLSEHDMK